MMPQDIMMSLFAFLIAIVSLCRIMATKEFFRLTMMKRLFGRKRGLALHFVVTVALPMLLGIVFLTGGVTGKPLTVPLQISDLPVVEFDRSDRTEPFEEDWLRYPDIVV